MKKIIIAVAVILMMTAAAAYFANEQDIKTVDLTVYDVEDENIPYTFNNYKILIISDLHNAPFSDQIISYINKTEPDITVFTGDLVQLPGDDLSETRKIVESTKDMTEFYGITGNHEMQNENLHSIVDELNSMGVTMVENRDVTLKKGGSEVNLAGLSDPGVNSIDEDDIEGMRKMLDDILDNDDDMYTILLSHRSVLYPYIKDCGADLILSGDLHGGIIRLPFIGGLINETGELDPPVYEYGYYKEGDSAAMVVSAGCDKNPNKKRYFNSPEVVLVTLKTK